MMRIPTVLAVLALCAPACSSSVVGTGQGSSGTAGSSGSTPLSKSDCQSRCEDKITGCGASAGTAAAGCDRACAVGLTEDQASCLEDKTCNELAQVTSLEAVCPSDTAASAEPQN